MSKIIIDIKSNKTIINYKSNDNRLLPICSFDKDNFNISEVTGKHELKLISEVIYRCGKVLMYKVKELNFDDNALNLPSNSK